MREILFRGKRIDNGEWVFGDIIHRRYLKKDVVVIRTEDSGFDNYSDYEVDPSTVGQCVSDLPDMNGKKIFEGDIVKINTVSFETYVKITYSKGTFWIEKIKHDFINLPALPFISEALDYCVAGNIYDNPELLKGE